MIRDFFWNYPKNFSHFVRVTSPLFYIFLAFLIGYVIFSTLSSDFVGRFVEGRDSERITEGVVGSLMSTNPMYTTQSSVDRDFYELVYEKFIDIGSDGEPLLNIVEKWDLVGDLEYTFTLRQDVFWHDGTLLTSDDVVWNFETAMFLAQELGEDTYGSNLEGVEIERIDTFTVKFTLSAKNATFWEAISVYLIPKHVYGNYDLNDFAVTKTKRNPVGCGMYMVDLITTKGFFLEAFEGHWNSPNIKKYEYLFFEDYGSLNSAIKNNKVDIASTFDLEKIEDLEEYPFFDIYESVLYNRHKLIFFNTRREKYRNSDMREAVSLLIDKERLLEESGIGGVVAHGPISPKSWAFNDSLDFVGYEPERATEILDSLGFVKDSRDEFFVSKDDEKIFSMELSFFENDINLKFVNLLQQFLQEEGVLLKLKPLTFDQVVRETLPTRNFELLLFEIEVTVDPDQYNLWHSLRIDYPMLNISGYEYTRVDILLERARSNMDMEERKGDYFLFQKYLLDDSPVVFLYHPKAYFIMRKNLGGFNFENISSPSQRYENIHEWHWDI